MVIPPVLKTGVRKDMRVRVSPPPQLASNDNFASPATPLNKAAFSLPLSACLHLLFSQRRMRLTAVNAQIRS